MNVYFSLVTFKHSLTEIVPLLSSISQLHSQNRSQYSYYLLIHENTSNSPLLSPESILNAISIPLSYTFSENVGFGSAHNINFKKVNSSDSLFVVVNPDIEFCNISLSPLFDLFLSHSFIVAVSPLIVGSNGRIQFSAKTDPSFLSLLLGRFSFLRIIPLLNLYYISHTNSNIDYKSSLILCTYLSGCFIVMRSSSFRNIHGFDESFFLHLEDADLTMRLSESGFVAHVPIVTVVHRWARGSHKSLFQMVCLLKSYIYFIKKWGFKLF